MNTQDLGPVLFGSPSHSERDNLRIAFLIDRDEMVFCSQAVRIKKSSWFENTSNMVVWHGLAKQHMVWHMWYTLIYIDIHIDIHWYIIWFSICDFFDFLAAFCGFREDASPGSWMATTVGRVNRGAGWMMDVDPSPRPLQPCLDDG